MLAHRPVEVGDLPSHEHDLGAIPALLYLVLVVLEAPVLHLGQALILFTLDKVLPVPDGGVIPAVGGPAARLDILKMLEDVPGNSLATLGGGCEGVSRHRYNPVLVWRSHGPQWPDSRTFRRNSSGL